MKEEKKTGDEGRGRDIGLVADALRLFYHAVAILSHRSNDPAAGSASYLRRLDSASSILRLCSHRRDWPQLSVVSYAVSLALTTFYLVFRRNGEGGREGCIQSCEILETLAATGGSPERWQGWVEQLWNELQ
jgi:hypothetical protein